METKKTIPQPVEPKEDAKKAKEDNKKREQDTNTKVTVKKPANNKSAS